MLAEFRQLKLESDAQFNGMQTQLRRVVDRLALLNVEMILRTAALR